MLKVFFVIALIITAICGVFLLRYRGRYNKMVAAATTRRAKNRLELDPDFVAVCDKGANSMRLMSLFGIISVVLLTVMLVTAITGNIEKNGGYTGLFNKDSTEEAYADGEEDTADDIGAIPDDVIFYNDKVQDKGNGKNFNFGPNAYKDAKRGYAAREELLRRCENDPALLAAVDSWLDVNLGTNLCGVFFEDNAEWRQAINDYIDAMVYDPQLFHNSYEATYALIMEESTPSVEKIKSASVEDQMYMLPKQYTTDGKIPTLVVMATDHSKGHYLTLEFKVKGDTFKIRFRMECGFQPTNCAEKLNTTPGRSVSVGSGSSKKTTSPGKKGTGGGNKPTKPNKPNKPTKPTKPSGDGCKDKQTWTPSGGQQVEKRTDTPSGGGNSKPNTSDPPSGGATRIDQGSGGGSKTPDPPKSDPVVDSGNGKVSGDD